jgi:acetyltransferase-like isoleucine patch superfamily enzyme
MEISPFYSRDELLASGFSSVGEPVWVSRQASLVGVSGSLGKQVHIGDFCVLSGRLEIGDHARIAEFCLLNGEAGLLSLGAWSIVEERVSIFTRCDDVQASALGGVLAPQEMQKSISGDVSVGRAALVGALSVLMPGLSIGDAAALGPNCLVSESVAPGAIVLNGSARNIAFGKKDVGKILETASQLLSESGAGGHA